MKSFHANREWYVHISHEAARPLGGIGVYTRQLTAQASFRKRFGGGVVLAGPLLFPEEGDCRTRTNLETIQSLARRLSRGDLELLYPCPALPTPEYGEWETAKPDHLRRIAFHEIEKSFKVGIFHCRDSSGLDLLLLDQSSSFGHHFIRDRHLNLAISRIKLATDAALYPLPDVHPYDRNLAQLIRNELLSAAKLCKTSASVDHYELGKDFTKAMERRVAQTTSYFDYSYVLGFAMGEPMARALEALIGLEDPALIVTNDYFGLPSLYLAKDGRRRDRTRTMLYVNEVGPVRHLSEQQIPFAEGLLDNGLLADDVALERYCTDLEFEQVRVGDGPLYSIIDGMTSGGRDESSRGLLEAFDGIVERYRDLANAFDRFAGRRSMNFETKLQFRQRSQDCKAAAKNLDIRKHAASRVLALAEDTGVVDIAVANGENSRKELLALLPARNIRDVNVKVIPHGTSIHARSCIAEDRIKARSAIVEALAHANGVFVRDGKVVYDSDVSIKLEDMGRIFLKVSRPVACKAFDRDLGLCKELSGGEGDPLDLLLVVSEWDQQQRDNPIHAWIELAKEYFPKRANRSFAVYFINRFSWPEGGFDGCLPSDGLVGLTPREILYLASDVSLSQSRYESFGLSQIEPLQFGAICTIAAVSGAAARLIALGVDGSEVDSPVVLADYGAVEDRANANRSGLSVAQVLSNGGWRGDRRKADMKAIISGIADKTRTKLKCRNDRWLKFYQSGKDISRKCFGWDGVADEFLAVCRAPG